MSLTKCPDCRRLSFVKAESSLSCERMFWPGELRAQANAEERAFGRRSDGVFAALITAALAAFAFVLIGGA
jgi:hypothetical protein